MRRCLEIVENALREAGAGLEHVVRTRVYLTDAAHATEAMRAHGEAFESTRPACTAIVCDLLDPRWLLEVEVEAVAA
jgi:enamine deaminase RidA (YjgF/YER057c/UK114 family)